MMSLLLSQMQVDIFYRKKWKKNYNEIMKV